MSDSKFWLRNTSIPEGYQIFEDCIAVAGVPHRKSTCRSFLRSKITAMALEREPSNTADANAIKVIGIGKRWFRQRDFFIGYLPAEVSEHVMRGGWWGRLLPRLYKTYWGRGGFIDIKLQLLGPRGEKAEWAGDAGQWRFSNDYRA
jgi:hypothetical protein